MFKYLFFLFFSVSFISNLFSQEVKISTEFSNNGSLYVGLSEDSKILTEFNENDECLIIDYLGKDTYKISYKELVGYVKAGYLLVNDDMIELVIAYEDKIRIEAIEKENKRKREVDELIRKGEEEKQKQEALKIKDAEELNKRLQDSIAKVQLEVKQKQEELKLKRKVEEEMNRRLQDSILKINQDKKADNKISDKVEFRNTCDYSINEFDKFYGIRTIRTNPYSINKKLTVEFYKQAQRTNIFFNLSEDLGCASYLPNVRSNVKVTLENDDVVAFYHSWDIDCGNFNFKGNLSNSDMERLKKSPIKSITLNGTENSRDITEIDFKEFFINKLKCIE